MNETTHKYHWLYLIGFFVILALPLLATPYLFHPPVWGKTIVFRIVLSVLIFLFIYQILFRKEKLGIVQCNVRHSSAASAFWLLIALLGIYLLTTIFSLDPHFSFWGNPYRSGGFLNFASYIIFAILAFFILSRKNWQKLWGFSIFIGILVSAVAIFQQFGIFSKILIPFSGRPPSTIGGPIFLALYLLLLTFITFSFAINEKKYLKKIFYFSAVLLFLFVILITGSRAAYFGLFIGFFYFIFLYSVNLVHAERKTLFLLVKVLLGILLIILAYGVYYLDSQPQRPQFIQDNEILNQVANRLLIRLALDDPRYSAWIISFEAVKEKPILGYGPENFSIAFDKYYDPSLPYITKEWGNWYDKAHNFLFDITVTAGIPALIIYLSLFASLFWGLQKIKKKRPEQSLIYHGIQATFLAYLAANFFCFDTYSTYLISFLFISYSLYLISSNTTEETLEKPTKRTYSRIFKWKKPIFALLLIVLIWFIWSFNLKPLQINKELNIAVDLAEAKKCERALNKNEQILAMESTFLDAYVRVKYFDNLRTCEEELGEMTLEIAQKGTELLEESTQLWPYHTRSWMFLGQLTNVIIDQDSSLSLKEKNELIKKSHQYFKRAQELSPKRQEIYIKWAKTYIVSKDYQGAKQKAQECINLNPKTSGCWWTKGIAEAFLGEKENSQKDIATAVELGHNPNTYTSLSQLANAYFASKSYPELAETYEKLIELKPNEHRFYASLAFVYKELGEYEKAREKALKVLELYPEAKEEVDEFLESLPR